MRGEVTPVFVDAGVARNFEVGMLVCQAKGRPRVWWKPWSWFWVRAMRRKVRILRIARIDHVNGVIDIVDTGDEAYE